MRIGEKKHVTILITDYMASIAASPLIFSFASHSFSYLRSTAVQKYETEDSRNKQFTGLLVYGALF